MNRGSRSRKGTGITEIVLAAVLLVPIAFCLLDLMTLVIANQMNDTLAKNAARAGANQRRGEDAFQAASNSLSSFQSSPIVKSIVIESFSYAGVHRAVKVQTRMVVKLPIPLGSIEELTFMAKDVEPILIRSNM